MSLGTLIEIIVFSRTPDGFVWRCLNGNCRKEPTKLLVVFLSISLKPHGES